MICFISDQELPEKEFAEGDSGREQAHVHKFIAEAASAVTLSPGYSGGSAAPCSVWNDGLVTKTEFVRFTRNNETLIVELFAGMARGSASFDVFVRLWWVYKLGRSVKVEDFMSDENAALETSLGDGPRGVLEFGTALKKIIRRRLARGPVVLDGGLFG